MIKVLWTGRKHPREQAAEINPEYPKLLNKIALLCVIVKNAEKFCKYNHLLDKPVTIEEARQHLEQINPELIDDFIDFMNRVNEIENTNL